MTEEQRENGTTDSQIDGTDYPAGFYQEQAPVHLRYVSALRGHTGPDIDVPFNYCELGCGPGETVTLLAAAHPHAHFVGMDLSDSHIEYGREIAQAAELDNLELIAADVNGYDVDSLPDFDFITLHGLYSWVPARVQASVREFIAAKLKPGGLAYVSYNAMPGWAAAEPLRHFIFESAKHLEGSAVEKVGQILEALGSLDARDAPFFVENPMARQLLRRLRDADPRYVAHEFLGPNWEPLYAERVHDAMGEQGLEFIADADITWSVMDVASITSLDELLPWTTDSRAVDWVNDFALNRFFRRDIFSPRGDPGCEIATANACAPRSEPSTEPLESVLFGTVAPASQMPERVNLPDGTSLDFADPWHARVRDLLAYRVRTLAELRSDPVLSQAGAGEIAERLKRLTVGGFFAPCATRETHPPNRPFDAVRPCPRLNALRLERHDWSAGNLVLVSPVTGSGVALRTIEVALLLALAQPEPRAWAHAQLTARGLDIRPIEDGESGDAIEDEDEALEAIGRALEDFTSSKLPKLAYLGVVEGA